MQKYYTLKTAICASVASIGLLALPGALLAGTESTGKEVAPVVTPKTDTAISGDAGVNFVSAYFTRGLMQENQGLIAQPYADLFASLYEGSGFVNKVAAQMGIWASVQSHYAVPPGNPPLTKNPSWYEFDWMPGIAVTLAKNFTLTTSYYEFDSPADAFAASRNLNVNLAYDDSGLLSKFALHPHFTYLRELTGAAGLQGPRGNYFEVGVAPAAPAMGPVTLSLPATVGLGGGGFYAGTTLGYIAVGPNIAVALPVPARFGTWTFNTSATYYHLNGAVATQDAGRHNDWVFSGGVGMTF